MPITEAEKPLARLIELRKARGHDQKWMAEALGVGQSFVSQIERADNIRVKTMLRYAAALGAGLEIVDLSRGEVLTP